MKTILIRPIITEKVNRLTERTKQTQFAFVVNKDANKIEVRKEIEKMYNVEVKSVRTVIVAPRVRRRFTKTGILEGKTKSYKKAYVSLKEGHTIDFYKNLQ